MTVNADVEVVTGLRAQILSKIQKVREAVPNVEKDAKNQFSKYKYTSAAAVLNATQRAEVDNGIVLVPTCQVLDQSKDGKNNYCTLIVSATVMDSETGYELPSPVVAIGKGMDVGDKAPYKAMTGGMKYVRALLYGFSFGDDPEVARPDENPKAGAKRAAGGGPASQGGDDVVPADEADAARERMKTRFREQDVAKMLGDPGTPTSRAALDAAREKFKAARAAGG